MQIPQTTTSGAAQAETHPALIGFVFWVFGFFGLHRFYFGYPLMGILYLLTGGLLGIGWIVDLFFLQSMSRSASRRFPRGHYDYSVAWLLFLVLGWAGVHRFYLGKTLTGILYLLTFGVFGIGILFDYVMLNDIITDQNRLTRR
ncbi:MAG: TM2 domain-containing protein [Planctomycetota bacterium]